MAAAPDAEDDETDVVLSDVEVLATRAEGLNCPCVVLKVDPRETGTLLDQTARGTLTLVAHDEGGEG